jgi:leucyl-tRNA synthetase
MHDWPIADPTLLVLDKVTVAVQVNGKLRATIDLPVDADSTVAETTALSDPSVQKAIENASVQKVIVVPNRIVNIVVRS